MCIRDSRQTVEPLADDAVVRHVPPHDGMDPGDVQPQRRDRGLVRDVPQRHDGDREAVEPHSDDAVVRHVPPHDGVDPGDIQPQRRDRGLLCDLPQRHGRNRQAVEPHSDDAVAVSYTHLDVYKRQCHTRASFKDLLPTAR